MHETEAEVLARIDRTRARMGETIDQIGDRVNPDRVQAEIKARARHQVREVKANMKYKARSAMRDIEHEVSDAGRGLWDTIRENPIPAGMVGVGLAWLVANGARDDHDALDYRYAGAGYTGARPMYPRDDLGYGYDVAGQAGGAAMPTGYSAGGYVAENASGDHGRMDEMKDRASEAKDRVQEKAHDAADEVRDRASHLTHRASEKMHDVQHRASEKMHGLQDRASEKMHGLQDRASEEMHEMQHRASHAARQAGQRARRAERRVEDAVQDNPLAAGAIAAALGFAAGMMIPESRREQEMFGRARDRMVENAERTVRRAGEKARDAAKDAVNETVHRAVDEVTGGGSKRERAGVSEPGR